MHVSNETGAINDLKKIDQIRQKYCPKALFHVDGVQAFCKLEFSVDDFNADYIHFQHINFMGQKALVDYMLEIFQA